MGGIGGKEEDTVGDVIGDLNSRRGRPLGMEPGGAGMTEVKAEVPMAEMLVYAPDLRSITGRQIFRTSMTS